jgi:hypothetical protein
VRRRQLTTRVTASLAPFRHAWHDLFARFGEEGFFPTLGEAVRAYRETHSVEWVDWDDEARPAPRE